MSGSPAPLAGRVALVVGATGGLGSAICHTLAGAGASVLASCRRREAAARALVDELPRAGAARHTAVCVEVERTESLTRLAAFTRETYGTLDILVNGAGTTRFVAHEDLQALDDELIDEIFRINWRGPFATIRAVQPLLARSGQGVIVNISSTAAVTGIGSNIAYCASKAALNAMTVSLARALAPAIRVVSVSPGVVDTGFIQGLPAAWRDEQRARTPLGRFARPQEVADAVLAVATLLRYSTGCIVPVDGGRPLS